MDRGIDGADAHSVCIAAGTIMAGYLTMLAQPRRDELLETTITYLRDQVAEG